MIDANFRAMQPVSYESSSVVPTGYAEKAMASLMQLHSELMDEKERRVDLYRRLMDKEQVVAELRMYVQLLEEKLAPPEDGWSASRACVPRPSPLRSVPAPPDASTENGRSTEPANAVTGASQPPRESSSARTYRASAFAAAASLNSATRGSATSDGWKAW